MDKFDFTPVGTEVVSSGFRSIDTTFENGSYQRRYKGAKPRQWRLTFRGKMSEKIAIKIFFDTHNDTGTWTFLWHDPLSDADVTVCFADPSALDVSLSAPYMMAFDVSLKEVI